MNPLWIVLHTYPGGLDAWAIRSRNQPSEAQVLDALDIHYRRGQAFGESLQIIQAEDDDIIELADSNREAAGPSF
jgi:hypothetical protein